MVSGMDYFKLTLLAILLAGVLAAKSHAEPTPSTLSAPSAEAPYVLCMEKGTERPCTYWCENDLATAVVRQESYMLPNGDTGTYLTQTGCAQYLREAHEV